MTTISPSLLAANFLKLEDEISALDSCHNIWLHLDIMDGHFVPNLTFGHDVINSISKVTTHPLDAHFMVSNPEFYLKTLAHVPLHNFTFHLESVSSPVSFAKEAKNTFPSVGVSIKPQTSVDQLDDELLKVVDLVLIMSVEPGFGGQSFMPESLNKVKRLVQRRETSACKFIIQIDGGINELTAKDAILAGADNLVAGSAVFKKSQSQYLAIINSLRSLPC